jgi:CRP-like cAMP-binding protein
VPTPADSASIRNRILAALPGEEFQLIRPRLEAVSLTHGEILYHASDPIRHVYFPNDAVISIVVILENGATVEVGPVGNEGMAGFDVVLGANTSFHQVMVQVAGSAVRMSAEVLKKECSQCAPLQAILLRYTMALHIFSSQSIACFRLHTIEERLCRWLLAMDDRAGGGEFELTQEIIAEMLGTQRSGVTLAARALQKAGLIDYTRGRIAILDREGLEEASCECYQVVKEQFDKFLRKIEHIA